MEQPGEITELLDAFGTGNAEAESRLAGMVYGELKRLAAIYMRRERPDHTLQPTALANEVYLKLVEQSGTAWRNRVHFFAVAARIMRRILVDHARAHFAAKRGGHHARLTLDETFIFSENHCEELLALEEALRRLERWDARQSQVVELRFFGGLREEEIAQILGVSVRTVKRDWGVAKAWLYGEMSK